MLKIELSDEAAQELWLACDLWIKTHGMRGWGLVEELRPQVKDYLDKKAAKNGTEPNEL